MKHHAASWNELFRKTQSKPLASAASKMFKISESYMGTGHSFLCQSVLRIQTFSLEPKSETSSRLRTTKYLVEMISRLHGCTKPRAVQNFGLEKYENLLVYGRLTYVKECKEPLSVIEF